jgi:thymidylate synthase ThyX
VSALGFAARVLADSVASNGCRLTTLEVTMPRIVLAEFNTHRVFSRNSASSRAIPFEKQLLRIMDEPFLPIYWGVNQPGMQAYAELTKAEQVMARRQWKLALDLAILSLVPLAGGVNALKDKSLQRRLRARYKKYDPYNTGLFGTPLPRGVHKQTISRPLEAYMWHTVIVTATEWDNFWALRINKNAQPEIRRAAELMKQAYDASTPQRLRQGQWHMPLIQPDEQEWAVFNADEAFKVSVGRCARVSYLTHDGIRDHSKDIELYEQLTSAGHMSPLEHVARPMSRKEFAIAPFSGNFRGWHQYRKDIPNEDNFAKVLEQAA